MADQNGIARRHFQSRLNATICLSFFFSFVLLSVLVECLFWPNSHNGMPFLGFFFVYSRLAGFAVPVNIKLQYVAVLAAFVI